MNNEAEIAQAAGNGLLDNQQKRPSKRDELALREEGRSLLPVSRVQRIIKADKELPTVAREAVFVISIATEEFIKRITIASQRQAQRESRAMVQKKDFLNVVERADEFFFLEDIFRWPSEERGHDIKKKAAAESSATGPVAATRDGALVPVGGV